MSYKKAVGTLTLVGAATGVFFVGGIEADASTHKVVRGDTLWDLSKQYNTSVSHLQKINGLNSSLIVVGDNLKLPDNQESVQVNQEVEEVEEVEEVVKDIIHNVKAGETLYRIGESYGVSVEDINQANSNITNVNLIYIGQKVTIPNVSDVGTASKEVIETKKVTEKIVTETKSSTNVAQSDEIIKTGEKFLGTAYQYGAKRGSTTAFDCSSFTQYVFKQHGIDLGSTSRDQYRQGTEVSKSNLQKGDLVFFSSPNRVNNSGIERVGHVGIYIGDGKMINANNQGVTYSDITSGYWANMYIGAKRVLK